MDLGTALSWATERYPSRRAVGGPRPLTYRQWDAYTNQLARGLAALGVRRGDRVALSLAGGEPLASLHLAAQKLGAVSVPLSTRFARNELGYCLSDAAPALLITDGSTVDRLPDDTGCPHRDVAEVRRLADEQPDSGLADHPDESDVSVMLYTSGTTGRPKGVPRTHRAEHYAALAHLVQAQHRPGEVTLGVMPMFHTMGLRSLLASILAAGTWVPQVRFDAAESLELMGAERVTALYLVPTLYWSLLRTGELGTARSLSRLAYAGAAMAPALAERLVADVRPEVFVNHFGSTEIYTFTVAPDVAAKPGSAGRAGMFSRVRLVAPRPDASPEDLVPAGEQGQVIASLASPEAFAGYWHRPDADAKAIRDGWYYTGDLAVADDEGDLWVSGRVDDMINSGGENIYPDEIEAVLVRCPAADDVCVVGLPDERWGEAVTAFVVPARRQDPHAALRSVEEYARSALTSLKRPKRLIAVREIPKSAVGKILRRTLVTGDYQPLAESRPGVERV